MHDHCNDSLDSGLTFEGAMHRKTKKLEWQIGVAVVVVVVVEEEEQEIVVTTSNYDK